MNPSNPASQSYDYQNGRGLDSFLSAAIDEVSWEGTLESTFNTLSQAPIGQSAYNNTTEVNYDQSAVTGSLGNAVAVGGNSTAAGGAGGASGGGNIIIDGVNGVIRIMDNNGNEVGVIGNLQAA